MPDTINEWSADKLIEYILEEYHVYIRESSPIIKEYCAKVAKVHGHANPEVIEINNLFNELADDLEQHMVKEERILFPYIKLLSSTNEPNGVPHFETVENPIRMMKMDHDEAGDIIKEIRTLSNDFTPPGHACNTYQVEYLKLEEFENRLFQHVHLENNVLFPKAIELEKTKATT